ncbi:TetR/AcrR family transcriptional regulator [Phenylobacterium sp.]|jgi:AcrR family transcriptional regulator|uniref:TetR/AcrR family transcriptional regulator n=1 Tax=Phenylobacterium sp. TaxID=1871053 RepID=UPI00378512B2
MSDSEPSATRSYHHGDLRRALVEAGRRLVEAEGSTALSLRAVAREAGVSPAAPYHHFKDKSELLQAIADQGWDELGDIMDAVAAEHEGAGAPGVAYVRYARAHPALYRVMYDAARDRPSIPDEAEDSAHAKVRRAFLTAADTAEAPLDLELAIVAAWCAAHGLAEMAAFKHFHRLRAEVGGEDAFLQAVLGRLGVAPRDP